MAKTTWQWWATPAERAGWRRLAVVPALRSVCVDKTSGRAWAVGEGETILRSDNRGASWIQQKVPPAEMPKPQGAQQVSQMPVKSTLAQSTALDLWSVSFADAKHGVAVGDRGMIFTTDDGGENWIRSAALQGDLGWVHMIDAKRGFVLWRGSASTTALGSTLRFSES